MTTFDSMSVAETGSGGVDVVHLDRSLRVTGTSEGFLAGLGRPTGEVCGRHFGHFVHADVKPGILERLGHLAEGRLERFSTGFRGPCAAGSEFDGDLTGLAVRTAGRPVSSIVLLVDTTEAAPRTVSAARDRGRLLSEIDAAVLEGVAAGCSTGRLADRLFLSRQGVDYHVGTLLRRFECPNRTALVAKAYARGVLHAGSWPPRVAPGAVR